MTKRKPESDTAEKGELIGYARVSTEDQELRMQIDALNRVGCYSIYQEKVSGRKAKRPKLDQAIAELRTGDTFVVWRLDRLARSMGDLLRRLEAIEERGAKFRSLTESFDTSTAGGRLLLHILGALAEFESRLTSERTRPGIEAARRAGGNHGAPRKFTTKLRREARRMLKKGKPRRHVAAAVGIAPNTLYLWIRGGMKD